MSRSVRHCILVLAILLTGASSAPADGPATRSVDQPRIQKLIAALAAETWRDRQAAEDDLSAMGSAIRPALLEALARTTDTEARSRIEAVLRQLAERDATGATLITIHLKAATPRQAFDAFFQQAGSPLRLNPLNLWDTRPFPPADIDIEALPYWTALRQLCKAYGIQAQNAGERSMTLIDQYPTNVLFGKAPLIVDGPFMVIAQTVMRSQSSELNLNQNSTRYCSIQLAVVAEPKLRVLHGSYMARLEEAVDENGTSLLQPNAQQADGMQRLTGNYWNLQATLKPADPLGDRIARIKGTARYWIQTRSEKLELANPADAKDRPQQIGSRSFTIKELKKVGEMWQMKISFPRGSWGNAEMVSLQDANGSTIRLLDADGKTLPRTGGVNTNFTGDNMMEMVFNFGRPTVTPEDKIADPARLVVELPTEMKEMVVPFEFTDLPMP